MTMNSRSDAAPELAMRAQGLQINTIDELARVAKMMADSGFFADAREAAQAGVKILAGQAWGIDPFSAMTGIHLIQGRPSVGAGLMAAKVKGSGRYDYRVREMTDKVCSIEFFEHGESIGTSTFTIEDAKKAGTKNLDKFPRNMLYARAMSNGVRWFCPDVFTTPTYTPEELGAQVDGDGNVITVEHRPSPAPKAEAQAAALEAEGEPAESPLSVDDFADPVPSGDELQAAPSTADGPFQDEKPAGKGKRPRTLTGPEAQRLHAKLGAVGLPKDEHHAFASAVLAGVVVKSLTQLTVAEAVEVNAIADRLARGEVEWKGGELILPPEEEAA